MTFSDHITRCDGFGDDPNDWLDECRDCQRRTAPRGADAWVLLPPSIVTLWCENYIPPDRPEDQRLRELARLQGLYAPPEDQPPSQQLRHQAVRDALTTISPTA